MGSGGRLTAAQNAAVLMTYELDETDQGGFIEYSDDATLEEELEPMMPGQIFNMAAAIQNMVPDGATSVGDGLQIAADEEDNAGLPENACVMVLLSDGYENSPKFWEDVEAEVADNECFMDVVGLGPTANEDLLQQIAASSPGGGSYDFAPVSGGVPIENANEAPESFGDSVSATTELSWENYLSRIFDIKTTRPAGRQRFMSAVGVEPVETRVFTVDDTTDELLVSVAWQIPSINAFIQLIPPSGVPLPEAGHQTVSSTLTSEIWREDEPEPGDWTVIVRGLGQQSHISATGRTLLELQVFTGFPSVGELEGVKVPIIANLSGIGEAITGADVVAAVTHPSGSQKLVTLFDDGLHADMDADDGVYGNWYTQTNAGEFVVEDPQTVVEGSEPSSRGSYLVDVVARLVRSSTRSPDEFLVARSGRFRWGWLPDLVGIGKRS